MTNLNTRKNQDILETIVKLNTKKETVQDILKYEGVRIFKLELEEVTLLVKLSNLGVHSYFYLFAINPDNLIKEGEYKEVRNYIIELWQENSITDEVFYLLLGFLNKMK